MFEKENNLPTKPALLCSIPLGINIQAAGYCNPNVLKEQNMACVLSLQIPRWFLLAKVGNVAKSWEIFMKTTEGDTDLLKKVENTHAR